MSLVKIIFSFYKKNYISALDLGKSKHSKINYLTLISIHYHQLKINIWELELKQEDL